MLDTGRGVPPGRMPWSVGEGHGPPAGVCGGAGVPGPMRASAPTRCAAWRGNVVSRLPTGPALGRRGGFHIRPRDPAPPRGCPGRCKHRPLQRLQQCGVRDFTGGCKPAVGCRGGFHIRPGDLAPPRGCPGRCEHRPLQRLQQCGVRDFTGGCKPAVGCRGGFHIRPGNLAAAWILRGGVAAFSQICRAGVHACRTTALSKWKRSNRRGARRDEGIPPYGRPGVTANPFGRNVYHGSQGRATVLPQNLFQHFEPPAGRRSTLSKL